MRFGRSMVRIRNMALASRRPLFSLSVFCLPHQTFVSVFLLFNAHTQKTPPLLPFVILIWLEACPAGQRQPTFLIIVQNEIYAARTLHTDTHIEQSGASSSTSGKQCKWKMFFPISVRFLLLIPGRNVGSTLQYFSIKHMADLKEDTYYRHVSVISCIEKCQLASPSARFKGFEWSGWCWYASELTYQGSRVFQRTSGKSAHKGWPVQHVYQLSLGFVLYVLVGPSWWQQTGTITRGNKNRLADTFMVT